MIDDTSRTAELNSLYRLFLQSFLELYGVRLGCLWFRRTGIPVLKVFSYVSCAGSCSLSTSSEQLEASWSS